MSVLYIADSIARIVGLCLVLVGVLLTVFAIEKFTYLLDVTFTFQVQPKGFLLLYASMLPDVADFILPVTLVIAVYLTVLRKREAREYLILSGAGIGPRYILLVALGAGVVMAALCLFVSGFLKPASKYQFRVQYAQALNSALSKGLPGGKFYVQDDNVMFVAAAEGGLSKRMRVFGFQGERLERLTLSNCADVRAVGRDVISDLCNARVYLFSLKTTMPGQEPDVASDADCRFCASPNGQLNLTRLEAAKSTIAFDMKNMFGISKERRAKELDLFDLLKFQGGQFASAGNSRLAAGYFLLAFTCLFAVAVALGAVAATVHRTRVFALGAAIGVVVASVALSSSEILVVGPVEKPAYFMLLLGAGALFCAGIIVAVVLLLHQRLITPTFVQV